MAFKVVTLIALVVTVAGDHPLPSFWQDSLTYGVDEWGHNFEDNYSFTRGDGHFGIVHPVDGFNPVIYNHQSYNAGGGPSWNYLIPAANPGSLVPAGYSAPEKVLPSPAPWTHNAPSTYLTSATTPRTPNQQLPFGYVAPVAKISVPPGYKILQS